jgi:hypothetical protein
MKGGFRFDIESERNFELKIEKLYSSIHKMYKKNASLRQSKAFKHLSSALEMYFLPFKAHF